jgi:uncharacterized membrane protein YtjA (UPF0391 family)
MLRCSTMCELIACIAALFGFGAVAVTFHDAARISYYAEPIYDLAKLFFP